MNRPFELLSSTSTPLTHDLAAAFAAMKPSPTERPLMKKRLTDLRNKIDNDLAVSFHWATADLDGETYRVNGQHTAHLLADMNGKFPEGLSVHMDKYKVADESGLAVLFRQFDPRNSGRTPADVAGAYQGLEEDLRDVPRPIAKLAIEGIAWFHKEIEGLPPIVGDDRYEYFHETEYHEFIRWAGKLFSVKTPELNGIPIAAAMWGTWEANETPAREFWDEVARGGNPESDEAPTTKLDNWLKALKDKKQPGYVAKVKAPSIYQGCIHAWNAWRRDDTVLKAIKTDITKGFLEISE